MWVMGKKGRKKKRKKKKRGGVRGWRRKKERKKEKRKKEKEGEYILRVYRRRVEKNEKIWYFESCEKINKIIKIY
jgi:hypothetical protein